jgi:hypothetical protein
MLPDHQLVKTELERAEREGVDARVVLGGKKLVTERKLIRFRHRLLLKKAETYLRRIKGRTHHSDVRNMFEMDLGAHRNQNYDLWVLLKNPRRDWFEMSPGEFSDRAAATIQLNWKSRVQGRFGIQASLNAMESLGAGDRSALGLVELHRMLPPETHTRLVSAIEELARSGEVAEIAQNLVFDRRVPRKLSEAMLYVLANEAASAPVPARHLIYSHDRITARRYRFFNASPILDYRILPSDADSRPEPETLYELDAASPDTERAQAWNGLMQRLRAAYLDASE